jgi:hypothetical protein
MNQSMFGSQQTDLYSLAKSIGCRNDAKQQAAEGA